MKYSFLALSTLILFLCGGCGGSYSPNSACIQSTASNTAHIAANRAHGIGGYGIIGYYPALTNGYNEDMGAASEVIITTIWSVDGGDSWRVGLCQ